MISVAYRTSLEMFCDVKLHFSQLLTAHVLTVDRHFGDFIYLMKKCLPAKKIIFCEYELRVRVR